MRCNSCSGQQCSNELRCDHCRSWSWSSDEWAKVYAYNGKITSQLKRKKERKVQSISSSSFSLFTSPLAVPVDIPPSELLLEVLLFILSGLRALRDL